MKEIRKISLKKTVYILMCIGLSVSFVVGVFTSSVSHAQGKVKPEWVMPEHYPKTGFDGMGRINTVNIGQNEVVIDEFLYNLSPMVQYNTPILNDVSSGDFIEGKLVGFIVDSKDTIVSMWLIQRDY
jgi:hypothetical protein